MISGYSADREPTDVGPARERVGPTLKTTMIRDMIMFSCSRTGCSRTLVRLVFHRMPIRQALSWKRKTDRNRTHEPLGICTPWKTHMLLSYSNH